MISDIKNTILRRMVLVISAPFMILACAFIGVASIALHVWYGAKEGVEWAWNESRDVFTVFRRVWNG